MWRAGTKPSPSSTGQYSAGRDGTPRADERGHEAFAEFPLRRLVVLLAHGVERVVLGVEIVGAERRGIGGRGSWERGSGLSWRYKFSPL